MPFSDEPEASVRQLDGPVSRILQLPGDSGKLVSQSWFSENQSESGSNPPDICRGGVCEFLTDGPFELKFSDIEMLSSFLKTDLHFFTL